MITGSSPPNNAAIAAAAAATAAAAADSTSKKIEILSINDKNPDQDGVQITPNERMVVSQVIEIWKQDPETESLGVSKLHLLVKQHQPCWSVSEKRLKTLLKKYGLLANQPKYYYVNEIISSKTPNMDMPEKIKLQMVKGKGKGLYATRNISEGTLLWQEKPFIFVPPLDHVKLMESGKACSYCGKLLKARQFDTMSFLNGLDCKSCEELYCSTSCKKNDTLHNLLNHGDKKKAKSDKRPVVNSRNWKDYKNFCLENHWGAAFAVGLIRVHELVDESGIVSSQFSSFAQISQETRYKASDSSAGAFDNSNGGDGALFVKEQQELLWHTGHEKFNKIFEVEEESAEIVESRKLSYEKYLVYIGTYNINNIESLYLIQSHLNHSCAKNVDVKVIDDAKRLCDGIKVYAARDIKANEELVTSYVNPAHNVHQRKRELRVNWGFNCTCQRCKQEEKDSHRNQSKSGTEKVLKVPSSSENIESPLSPKSDKSSMKSPSSNTMRRSGEFTSVREMLENAKGQGEFEIEQGEVGHTRRKSVRFDEVVVAVNE